MKRLFAMASLVVWSHLAFSAATNIFEFEFEELAPGVWAGVRPDSHRFPVMGNVTFVVSGEGVVVYDGGGMPAMAEQGIGKIRSLTDAPVTHVVISHWHGDHNFGIHRFAEEFPNVQFVAQRFTHAIMNSTRIRYIDNYPDFIANNLPGFQKILETGKNEDGSELSSSDHVEYKRIVADAKLIDTEYRRARVTSPNVVFDDQLTLYAGGRQLELLRLGHGNTEGDIVMWLPEEGIVATGDLVVFPTPYAFNLPPRAWAESLHKLNALGYRMLVPGHGEVQRDTQYVDLNIEAAESIADQRDALLLQDLSHEEVQAQLDFSAFEARFTGGDEYIAGYYEAYFEAPFRKAAIKALSGEPMVRIEPVATE
jgi:glyoxylase-like metal-dependent hydrolase (beta-lactamase superfamily II)